MVAWDTTVTGLGVFIGLVAGVIVQLVANQFTLRTQRKNAVSVFVTEAQLNLGAVENLLQQMQNMRERISANQANQTQLWISFEEFDFSATGPLNQTGHLHTMLGADGLKDHLKVLRFFNNQKAAQFSQMLQDEHKAGTSLSFLDWLTQKINEHKGFIENSVERAKA